MIENSEHNLLFRGKLIELKNYPYEEYYPITNDFNEERLISQLNWMSKETSVDLSIYKKLIVTLFRDLPNEYYSGIALVLRLKYNRVEYGRRSLNKDTSGYSLEFDFRYGKDHGLTTNLNIPKNHIYINANSYNNSSRHIAILLNDDKQLTTLHEVSIKNLLRSRDKINTFLKILQKSIDNLC